MTKNIIDRVVVMVFYVLFCCLQTVLVTCGHSLYSKERKQMATKIRIIKRLSKGLTRSVHLQ